MRAVAELLVQERPAVLQGRDPLLETHPLASRRHPLQLEVGAQRRTVAVEEKMLHLQRQECCVHYQWWKQAYG